MMSIDLLPNLPNKNLADESDASDLLPNLPNINTPGDAPPTANASDEGWFNGALEKAASYARPINEFIEDTGLPAFAGGMLQGAGNIPISILNTPSHIAQKMTGRDVPQIPYFNLAQFNEPGNEMASGFGELAGSSLPVIGAAGKILETARPGGYLGMLSDILRGAGTGYATGGNSDRDMAAIFGGILGGAKGISDTSIGKRIGEKAQNVKQHFNKEYTGIFKDAEKAGIHKLSVPKINTDNIVKNTPKKFHQSLQTFEANPTPKSAQNAQSDLGKFLRHMEKMSERAPLTSQQYAVIKNAEMAQKKIKGAMFNGFKEGGREDLWNKYLKTAGEYGENTHLLHNPSINKALKGEMSSKELAKALQNNTKSSQKFYSKEGANYPEIGFKKGISDLSDSAKYIGLGSAGGLAPYFVNKLLRRNSDHE